VASRSSQLNRWRPAARPAVAGVRRGRPPRRRQRGCGGIWVLTPVPVSARPDLAARRGSRASPRRLARACATGSRRPRARGVPSGSQEWPAAMLWHPDLTDVQLFEAGVHPGPPRYLRVSGSSNHERIPGRSAGPSGCKLTLAPVISSERCMRASGRQLLPLAVGERFGVKRVERVGLGCVAAHVGDLPVADLGDHEPLDRRVDIRSRHRPR
jgi:hypothetical protein